MRAPVIRQRGRSSIPEGFTLIELMVVIAIIVLAAGLMTPTITDFFKNRQLESVRGQLGAAFNAARLKAVNEGRKMSIVFFKEGVRVFDERSKTFVDELWNPDNSAMADDRVWFKLGFLGENRFSTFLPKYRVWEAAQEQATAVLAKQRRSGANQADLEAVNIAGLPRIIFERDGSLTFATGSDVSSAYFKESIPTNSDVVIYQANNTTACFVDLRPPGQLRNKMVPIGKIVRRPSADGTGDEKGKR